MIPSTMAKIHPSQTTRDSTMTSSSSSSKETYTIWTKSLIFHGNGCTVYDSNGVIVYRVDNYGVKRSREVQLMDLHGNVVFSLKGKRSCGRGSWYGYKGTTTTTTKEMPWFHARETRSCGVLNRSSVRECKVIMGCDQESYRIEGHAGKVGFRISGGGDGDGGGAVVAEVKRKESWGGGGGGGGGVLLGDDVLTLVVEPRVDHSLVMALVIVYGLMRNII